MDRGDYCGTHLRSLYLAAQAANKTEQRKRALEQKPCFVSTGNNRKEWETFVKGSKDWEEVPDAAFFAFLWWKREIREKKISKRRKVMGVPLPGFPSLKVAKQETRKRAVGQWNYHDRLDQNMLPINKQAELFANGHFPIGKIWVTHGEGEKPTHYAGRVVSLSSALVWLTVNAERKKLLTLKTEQVHFIWFKYFCSY
jgi:hypothetical protein